MDSKPEWDAHSTIVLFCMSHANLYHTVVEVRGTSNSKFQTCHAVNKALDAYYLLRTKPIFLLIFCSWTF